MKYSFIESLKNSMIPLVHDFIVGSMTVLALVVFAAAEIANAATDNRVVENYATNEKPGVAFAAS